MKKSVAVSLLAIALLLVAAPPSHAWRRHPGVRSHVFVGVGPRFVWGPPYWYYPHWYYPPPYYVYTPPTVVVEEPPVYIEQPAPAPAPPSPPQTYWYYCRSAQGYYPNVQTCPEAWIPVAPKLQ